MQIKNVLTLLKNCNWFSDKIPYDTTTVKKNEITISITPTRLKYGKMTVNNNNLLLQQDKEIC